MAFRITGDTETEIGGQALVEFLAFFPGQIDAAVHFHELLNEARSVAMAFWMGDEYFVTLPRVAPQGQNVPESFIMHIDAQALDRLFGSAGGDEMSHGWQVEFALDESGQGNRPAATASQRAASDAHETDAEFFVQHLYGV